MTQAGIDPQLRFHDLRHSAASIARSKEQGGETAKVVQQLLRHSSQQVTTEIYMHLFPEDLERLRDSLDRVYEASVAATADRDRDPDATSADSNVVSLSTRRGKRGSLT